MSLRPLLLNALALAAFAASFDIRAQAQDQVPGSLIIEGDQIEQVEGSIDAAEAIIRDNGRLELVGGFSEFAQVLLEDDASAKVLFGLDGSAAFITTTGRSQLDIAGVGTGGVISPVDRRVAAFLQPRGSSQVRVTDVGVGRDIFRIAENATLTAPRTRVGGEVIDLSGSATLIAIDSQVVPIQASGLARVELFGGSAEGTAALGGNFFGDQSSVLVDGFTISSQPFSGNFGFNGEATGVFRGDTRIIDNRFISVSQDAEVRIEGGTYIARFDTISDTVGGAFDVSGGLIVTGGTIEYADRAVVPILSLFRATDDGVITLEGADFTDDPDVLTRFAAAAAEPTTIFPGASTVFSDPEGEFRNPAFALFDQSQLVLLSDEVTINGESFGLGDADTLTLTDLPEFGVFSAVLADGNPFEASFIRELGTTITLRAADPGDTPNPIPTPTALGGGLLLGLSLRRRR